MAAVSLESMMSTGHGCFPPRPAVGPYTSTSFFNGKPIQLLGHTKYAVHCCGPSCHDGTTSGSSSTFFFEGKQVCRIGDDISCGDVIAEGSGDTFIG